MFVRDHWPSFFIHRLRRNAEKRITAKSGQNCRTHLLKLAINIFINKYNTYTYVGPIEDVLRCLPIPQNRDQPEVQLYMSAPLKFMSSRMSPRIYPLTSIYVTLCIEVSAYLIVAVTPSIRHSGKFPRQFLPPAFFVYKYKTSAFFVTGKCRLKVKGAGETCQDGVNMAYWWRIFGHAHWKKRGQVFFTRVRLLVDFYSVYYLFNC